MNVGTWQVSKIPSEHQANAKDVSEKQARTPQVRIEQPQNSTNNHPKINQHRPKVDPKSVQNRPKLVPESVLEQTSLPRRFWGQNLRSSWEPKSGHVGAMLAKKLIFLWSAKQQETNMIFNSFRRPPGTDFGTIFGPKLDPKSAQKRSQERSSKKCKNIKKPLAF